MSLTKEEIIEGNRLIKAFMNPDKAEEILRLKDWWVEYACHYNSQWSALMSVVERIEAVKVTDIGFFKVFIYHDKCTIKSHEYDIDGAIEVNPRYFNHITIGETKILSTWIAVVNWIKWYNENVKS